MFFILQNFVDSYFFVVTSPDFFVIVGFAIKNFFTLIFGKKAEKNACVQYAILNHVCLTDFK